MGYGTFYLCAADSIGNTKALRGLFERISLEKPNAFDLFWISQLGVLTREGPLPIKCGNIESGGTVSILGREMAGMRRWTANLLTLGEVETLCITVTQNV